MTNDTLHLETTRVQRIYDTVARRYDSGMALADRLMFGAGRRWVCAQVQGDVLELAIGTGRNLPYYPPGTRVTGIDLSAGMLAIADQRAAALMREVRLLVGDAQDLPVPAAQFDMLVYTLALCTIPDDRQAIAEAYRVLRPGGRLLLLEHVRSPIWPVQLIQRLLNPLAMWLSADHLTRDPLDYLADAGFVVDHVERLTWGIVERITAHKPR